MLFFRDEINQVYNTKRQLQQMKTVEATVGSSSHLQRDADIRVQSAIELRESLETFYKTEQKEGLKAGKVERVLS